MTNILTPYSSDAVGKIKYDAFPGSDDHRAYTMSPHRKIHRVLRDEINVTKYARYLFKSYKL